MKKSFIVVFFILSFFNGWSIDEQTDSLSNLTSKNEHDTIRANSFIQLSLLLYGSNFDTLYSLNKVAFDISTKNLNQEISICIRALIQMLTQKRLLLEHWILGDVKQELIGL